MQSKNMGMRIESILSLIEKSEKLADIGCDHAYLSIEIIKRGLANRVIATDLREKPLESAKKNIERAGLSDKIETRASDGLQNIKDLDYVDTVLISGMGGILIKDILERSSKHIKTIKNLVLEPQSDVYLVRVWLYENNFIITHEDMVREAGKYYQVLAAKRGIERANYENIDIALEFGEILIKNRHPLLIEFLENRRKHFTGILENKDFLKSKNRDRREYIETRLSLVNLALKEMGGSNDSNC